MKDIKTALGPYFGWIKLALLLFVVVKLWPLVSGIFGSFTKPFVDLSVQVKEEAQDSTDKALVKKVYSAATDSDVSVFKEDARAIAIALGYMPGVWSNFIIADSQTAFSTAKKYSRYLMNGSTVRKDSAGKWLVRKQELRLPVIAGLYKDITGGRVLDADLTGAFSGTLSSTYLDLYTKYIR